jgi:hypothetical protein
VKKQLRAPKGSPIGGQWIDQGASALKKPDLDRQHAIHEVSLDERVPLSDDQEKAVENYAVTPGFYTALANKLRGTDTPSEYKGPKPSDKEVDKAVKDLDKAIAKQKPSEGSFQVYRGISLDNFDIDDKLDGVAGRRAWAAQIKEIQDNSFVSTSASDMLADNFAMSSSRGALLRIHVPKGTKFLPIGAGGPERIKEEEILFARGTRIRILHVVPKNTYESDYGESSGIIDCEIVP